MSTQLQEVKRILGIRGVQQLTELQMTPEMAKELVKFNTHNRPRNKQREKEYAADMREGKFGLQESVISFDNEGVLTNGQTRLFACIDANKSFPTIVKLGLEQNLHMDTGKNRTTVDNVNLSGALDGYIDSNRNNVVKVAKCALRLGRPGGSRVRDEEVVEFCKLHTDTLNKASELGLFNLSSTASKHMFKLEIAAAFLCAAVNGINLTDLQHIRNVLTDGQMRNAEDTIVIKIRDFIKDNGHSASGSVRSQNFYGLQFAINSYTNKLGRKRLKTSENYYPIMF